MHQKYLIPKFNTRFSTPQQPLGIFYQHKQIYIVIVYQIPVLTADFKISDKKTNKIIRLGLKKTINAYLKVIKIVCVVGDIFSLLIRINRQFLNKSDTKIKIINCVEG